MVLKAKNWSIATKFIVGILPVVTMLSLAIGYFGWESSKELRNEISREKMQTLLETFDYAFEKQLDILFSKIRQIAQAQEFSNAGDAENHPLIIKYLVKAHSIQRLDFSFFFHEGKLIAKGHDPLYTWQSIDGAVLGGKLLYSLPTASNVTNEGNKGRWNIIRVKKEELINELAVEKAGWLKNEQTRYLTVMFTSSEVAGTGMVVGGMILKSDNSFIDFLMNLAHIKEVPYNSLGFFKDGNRIFTIGKDMVGEGSRTTADRNAKNLRAVRFEATLDLTRERQKESVFVLKSGLFLGLAIFFVSIIIFAIVYQLVKPINELIITSQALAAGDLGVPIDTDRHDQIGKLSSAFAAMRDSIIYQISKIGEYNDDLEFKVEQRTKELNVKSQDIRNILSNIEQGILTIKKGNMIHPEYSPYLEAILEQQDISGKEIGQVLFDSCNISLDAKSKTLSALTAIIGSEEVAYKLNKGLLVKDMVVNTSDSEKIIELQWSPILEEDQGNFVKEVILSIRDVTEIRALQKEGQKQKEAMELIDEILSVKRSAFLRFMESSSQMLKESLSLLEGSSVPIPRDNLDKVFLSLHTIKGNSRSLNFTRIVESAHSAEKLLDDVLHEISHENSEIIAAIEDVKISVDQYVEVYDSRFAGQTWGGELEASVSQYSLDRLKEFNNMERKVSYDESLAFIDSLNKIARGDGVPFNQVIESMVESLPSIAKELGKADPDIGIRGGCEYVPNEFRSAIEFTLVHLLRNSLDHGIEPPEVRFKKRKNKSGKIDISCQKLSRDLVIEVQDDGRGLNIAAISKKAKDLGLLERDRSYSLDEMAQFVFSSSFSTSESVTAISGRGVGMSAVKAEIEKVNGTVSIELLEHNANADESDVISIPFKVTLKILGYDKEGSGASYDVA